MTFLWKYFAAWLVMIPIAIANAGARELWYERRLGEQRAHQVSTVSLVVLLAVYVWLVIRIWPPASAAQAYAVGIFWLVLTLSFEFLFGHFVARRPWSALVHDFNIFAGRVWVAIPLSVAGYPPLFHYLQT